MTVHSLLECLPNEETGQWEFRCRCRAWFTSMSYGVAAEAFRNHMAEPAYPQEATDGV